ncbi:MAG: RDD family protein [Acidaminococcaceae bacterium]|nr:RDD family protein [Acidaminococcaceae bacterium]MDD4721328.1 RDD family protein [Acidaminococcaceae bacterium]
MTGKSLSKIAWLRFWARMFDYFLFGFIFLVLASHIPNFEQYPAIFFFVQILFLISSEAMFIAKTGTTPGKKFLGIHVVGKNVRTLSFKKAWYRTFWAYVKGIWLGLPVVMFVPAWFSKKRFIQDGTTIWDEAAQTEIILSPSNFFRKVMFVLVFLLIMFLIGNYSLLQQAMQQAK